MKIRFVDGPKEAEILHERYAEKFLDLTERERIIWELGFDYGVDDKGIDEKKSGILEYLRSLEDK